MKTGGRKGGCVPWHPTHLFFLRFNMEINVSYSCNDSSFQSDCWSIEFCTRWRKKLSYRLHSMKILRTCIRKWAYRFMGVGLMFCTLKDFLWTKTSFMSCEVSIYIYYVNPSQIYEINFKFFFSRILIRFFLTFIALLIDSWIILTVFPNGNHQLSNLKI